MGGGGGVGGAPFPIFVREEELIGLSFSFCLHFFPSRSKSEKFNLESMGSVHGHVLKIQQLL